MYRFGAIGPILLGLAGRERANRDEARGGTGRLSTVGSGTG